MNSDDNNNISGCQIEQFPLISEGLAEIPPESLFRKLRLLIRRSLNARQVRILKKSSDRIIMWFKQNVFKIKPALPEQPKPTSNLKAGDLVRVRSQQEIQNTLNVWGQLNGCTFLALEMSQYCDTIQRVWKPLERFVDERDYRVKKVHGIVLLEGVYCQGTTHFGRCDRSCFFFWREEWLEKVENPDQEGIQPENYPH